MAKESNVKDSSKEDVKEESSSSNDLFSLKRNPWIASTIVLAIALVLVLVFMRGFGGGGAPLTGNVVGAEVAASKALSFINSNPNVQGNVELVSSTREGDLYKVVVRYQGRESPIYTTLDGKYLIGALIPLDTNLSAQVASEEDEEDQPSASAPLPKTSKPSVEIFVMSHCPFGTQIQKGIIPVVELLKDKIDFEVKFVNYAMHPSVGEVEEQLRQYCIQAEQKDKYLDYLKCFLDTKSGSPDEAKSCLAKVQIDTKKLDACYAATDKKFNVIKNLEDKSSWINGRFPKFLIHDEENNKYGVRGSPTVVINGKQAASGRDPASLLRVICSSFITPPAECANNLSNATPSPGFGMANVGSAAANNAQCG